MAFSVARLTSEQDYDENQNQDDQNENYYDEYGNYVGPTHWWQFWKSNNNNNYNNNGEDENDNDERGTPWWCEYLKLTNSLLKQILSQRLISFVR